MIRLSIIIPFYNVEQYIAECLDSVYHQDIPEDEYEVICVNDASPDHSRDIVLEFQKKHANLILVEHDVNKKLGAARNTGRKIARGRYIWNVDSDDMIASNCLGEILKPCENGNLDVLCFAKSELHNDGNIIPEVVRDNISPSTGIRFIHTYDSSRLGALCPVWRYVFRKEFLDENNIFSPEINMGEDVPYTFKALFLARKIAYIHETWYLYRKNEQSLTGSKKILPPEVLYEKCFKNTWLILEVMQFLPDEEKDTRTSCRNVAKFTFSLWSSYYEMMDDENRKAFRTMCSKQYYQDRIMLKQVLSCRKYCRYLLWLLGI